MNPTIPDSRSSCSDPVRALLDGWRRRYGWGTAAAPCGDRVTSVSEAAPARRHLPPASMHRARDTRPVADVGREHRAHRVKRRPPRGLFHTRSGRQQGIIDVAYKNSGAALSTVRR